MEGGSAAFCVVKWSNEPDDEAKHTTQVYGGGETPANGIFPQPGILNLSHTNRF